MPRSALILLALCLGACAHNLPAADVPNSVTEAAQARVYVDMNGVMFPPGWRSPAVVGEHAVRSRHSIHAAVNGNETKLDRIRSAEDLHLASIARLAGERSRVFVFLVGFNTSHATAVELRAMQDAIGLGPDDLAIEFYWDGHDAAVYADAARIWFWGAGSSQVTGQRGLRRVLNAVGDKPVVLVSYSRGASVVLSALSDPAYAPSFRAETEALAFLRPAGPAFFETPPLAAGGPIRVVMLAPAIGEPDFWAPGSMGDAWAFRVFPERVASIRYSINPRDPVLTKGFTGLARHFNATDLGAGRSAGRDLDCHYRILQGYEVVGDIGHGVGSYIGDRSFTQMLRDSGVGAATAAPVVRRPDCAETAPPDHR
ncbi:MAG: hypothetical protein QME55_00020 [Brevundimonas sp.]|uniref:hypothetical protein n=1 Tax=Brevundimonas sp. TaxID=1871086 RepID=UPI00261BC0D2|nr:hypothetical protein [Brevundimonas sp.]MDI6623088.1 hypothetical protein [Brevundimonas sp.]MDQ7813478.1 hypothetical protein [Brevundimonas sp.]